VNENLRRAVEALEKGAAEVRSLSAHSLGEARSRLQRTIDEAHGYLQAERQERVEEPEDVMSRLDRQSRDIAEELRRVERLMRNRSAGD
jgi:hypothetical protein